MEPRELYLQHLEIIDRIAAFVARGNHLNSDETAEFKQEVHLRLMEDNYSIIRKFRGDSLFPTYLTTVIKNLFRQYRIKQWGKWRPSTDAKRLGEHAVILERLITRDGYTFDEAVKELTTPASSEYTVAELEAIYLRLPQRNPRPVLISTSSDDAPDVAATNYAADDRVEMRERESTARRVASALDRLIESMNAEDRLILKLRFWHELKVSDIAPIMGIEQKKLYKRLDRLRDNMRRDLETAGVAKSDIETVLSHD
jgi:RNA polymerase sigma factor (sigma-70 family)